MHTRRDGVAGLAAALGIITGSLGKMARDLSLLSQAELGEVAEPVAPGRGGSSTLPHKRNPVASMVALAAAACAPGRRDHARRHGPGAGSARSAAGRPRRLATLSALCEAAHGATLAMVEAFEGLIVEPEAMRRNVERLQGLILAERLMLALAPKMGRNEAHHAVEELSRKAVAENRHLRDLALADARIGRHLTPDEIASRFDPSGYLGATREFIDNALALHEMAREARARGAKG